MKGEQKTRMLIVWSKINI